MITDLGRVTPVLRGDFNALETYYKLDIVTYIGSSYICKQETTGHPTSDTAYWQLLAASGEVMSESSACGANLLHNWDFRNPINQRGVAGTITTPGYFFDRWMLVSGTVNIVSNQSVRLEAGAVIEQRIEGTLLAGKQVTVSVGTPSALFGVGTFPTSVGTFGIAIPNFGTITLGYGTGFMYVRFAANSMKTVYRVKLELGITSTLEKTPPVDLGEELPKCQRYFYSAGLQPQFAGRVVTTGTVAGCIMSLPVVMRTNPTISSELTTIYCNGTEYTGSSMSSIAIRGSVLYFTPVTSAAMPLRTPVSGHFRAASDIHLSADL